MNKRRTFPFSLKYEGEFYEGDITPSAQTGKNGMPVYFRVTVGDKLFAYLCCGDTGWRAHEPKGNATGLIQAIIKLIGNYYL